MRRVMKLNPVVFSPNNLFFTTCASPKQFAASSGSEDINVLFTTNNKTEELEANVTKQPNSWQ